MGLSTPSTGGGAPTDAEYVTGSSNSELTSETVVSPASDILTSGSFGSTVSLSPGFGNFTQVDANNPCLLFGEVLIEGDGSTTANVSVSVDESGGTTPTYNIKVGQVSNSASSRAQETPSFTLPLPAGAQFQIENSNDPANSNGISLVRALIIQP